MGFDRSFAVNISATYGDPRMPEYVLGHHLKGEGKRLALMSELLDPMHRRYLQSLGVVKSGARTLEVGCGNGSISAWLARQVAPDGRAMAVDLDLSLVDVRLSNLEFCKADIMAGPVEPGSFDLVTARAVASPCSRRRKGDGESRCKLAAWRRHLIDRAGFSSRRDRRAAGGVCVLEWLACMVA
jgi:SAM-dependent methyltransferase